MLANLAKIKHYFVHQLNLNTSSMKRAMWHPAIFSNITRILCFVDWKIPTKKHVLVLTDQRTQVKSQTSHYKGTSSFYILFVFIRFFIICTADSKELTLRTFWAGTSKKNGKGEEEVHIKDFWYITCSKATLSCCIVESFDSGMHLGNTPIKMAGFFNPFLFSRR